MLLWSGQSVSQMGDRLAMVVFPWVVYKSTDSAFSTALMLALYTLPYVLFGTVAGVAIDRFNKRNVMVLADVFRALVMVAVPVVAQAWLPGVFVLSFLAASAAVFFDPSKLAILPELIPPDALLRGNSLLVTTDEATDVVGYALAGVVAASMSTSSAFYLDALTFVVSAVALMLMRYSPAARERQDGQRSTVAGELREGISFLSHHRGLRATTAIVAALAISGGASYPLTFLLAVRVFGGTTRTFGLMESALALGFLLGGLILAALAARVPKGLAITVGGAVMGAALAIVGAASTLAAVLAAFLVIGLANAATIISADTYYQQTLPARLSGRVWSIRFTLTQTLYAISVLVGGALATQLDVQTLFIACGALVAIPGVVGLYITSVRRA